VSWMRCSTRRARARGRGWGDGDTETIQGGDTEKHEKRGREETGGSGLPGSCRLAPLTSGSPFSCDAVGGKRATRRHDLTLSSSCPGLAVPPRRIGGREWLVVTPEGGCLRGCRPLAPAAPRPDAGKNALRRSADDARSGLGRSEGRRPIMCAAGSSGRQRRNSASAAGRLRAFLELTQTRWPHCAAGPRWLRRRTRAVTSRVEQAAARGVPVLTGRGRRSEAPHRAAGNRAKRFGRRVPSL
jgi:hypothetical protein